MAKCPRKGTKVVFTPNPASAQLYSYRVPKAGTTGTITDVPLGGGRRQTCMPGPGGGLVYVKWADGSTMGVSAYDVQKAKKGKGGLGCACPPMPMAGMDYSEPLDDFEARDLLYQWHGGGGSGVYQVASMMDHGVPAGAYARARGELQAVRYSERERKAAGKRMSGGPNAIEELSALIAWLDSKIAEE